MADQRPEQINRASEIDRRTFLETGAALMAAGSVLSDSPAAYAQDTKKGSESTAKTRKVRQRQWTPQGYLGPMTPRDDVEMKISSAC